MWDNDRLLNALADVLYGLAGVIILCGALMVIVQLPVFALREVEVTGQIARTTRDQVHAIVADRLKGNFFTLDLDATRTAFQKLPWVRRATLRRRWPDRLEVDLEEHVVLARWRDSALVNTHGEVFEAATGEVLPVFIAPEGTALDVAQRYDAFRILLQPLRKRPVLVFLSARRAWELKLNDGQVLELGRSQMEERLQRFVTAYSRTLSQMPNRPYRVDLRYTNGFAVRATGLPLRSPGAG
jgi:cell division protein FtsQ